jgi:hypothetical protein
MAVASLALTASATVIGKAGVVPFPPPPAISEPARKKLVNSKTNYVSRSGVSSAKACHYLNFETSALPNMARAGFVIPPVV